MAEIINLSLKSIWSCFRLHFPEILVTCFEGKEDLCIQNVCDILRLCCYFVDMKVPPTNEEKEAEVDTTERAKWGWWKVKKRSCCIIQFLFEKYGKSLYFFLFIHLDLHYQLSASQQ